MKPSPTTRSLEIQARDAINVTDKLDTYKRWFNGLKHFFTVKALPPRK